MRPENDYQAIFYIVLAIIICTFSFAWVVTEVYFYFVRRRIKKL
jgi:hypothetical protein